MQARIKGSLKVFFYDTEAGTTEVGQVFARPRALATSPYMLEVNIPNVQYALGNLIVTLQITGA